MIECINNSIGWNVFYIEKSWIYKVHVSKIRCNTLFPSYPNKITWYTIYNLVYQEYYLMCHDIQSNGKQNNSYHPLKAVKILYVLKLLPPLQPYIINQDSYRPISGWASSHNVKWKQFTTTIMQKFNNFFNYKYGNLIKPTENWLFIPSGYLDVKIQLG